jgi:hypothetical protein
MSSHGHETRGGLPVWGLDMVLTTPHHAKFIVLQNVTWALQFGLILQTKT